MLSRVNNSNWDNDHKQFLASSHSSCKEEAQVNHYYQPLTSQFYEYSQVFYIHQFRLTFCNIA
jgi:hypothetical protein